MTALRYAMALRQVSIAAHTGNREAQRYYMRATSQCDVILKVFSEGR